MYEKILDIIDIIRDIVIFYFEKIQPRINKLKATKRNDTL